MTNLSEYSFSVRHPIYRNVSLMLLGEPTTVPFSRAMMAGLVHHGRNFRQHSRQSHTSSVLASVALLAAAIFCVIVWQQTTLPQPTVVQGGVEVGNIADVETATGTAVLSLPLRIALENLASAAANQGDSTDDTELVLLEGVTLLELD